MTAPHPALLDVAARRPMAPVVDEDALLASANEHRMVGALLAAAQGGGANLSRAGLTTLGVWDLAEGRAHLRFWRTMIEVQDLLAPLGVEVAVLKGIATEARWYDHLGERVSTDLDLFLDPDARPRVGAVIDRLDPTYRPRDPADWLVQRRILFHVDLHVGDTQVDLHLDPLKIGVPIRQLHQVWATTEEVVTPHGPIRLLAPEVELVLLLLHLNKDAFSYLGPFLDVGRILARASLDWSRVESFVDAEGLQVPVWSSLAKVAGVLDLDTPHPRPTGPRAWTWDRLWGSGRGLEGDAGRSAAPGRQKALALHFRGRPLDILAALRHELLPQRRLLEVAGRLDPGDSYARHVVVAALRRSARAHGPPEHADWA